MGTSARLRFHLISVLLLAVTARTWAQGVAAPYRIEFAEPRSEIGELNLPVDPTLHAQVQTTGDMVWGMRIDGKPLCFGGASIRTTFRIDGRSVQPTQAAWMPLHQKSNPGVPAYQSVWNQGNLRIVHTLHVVPTKPDKAAAGQKRRLDAVVSAYEIENNDTQPHSVGVRAWMDAYCWNTDGPLIISSKEPERVLNGVELKGKTLPPVVRCLSMGATATAGFAAHFVLKMGSRYEGPDRFLHTTHVPPALDDWNFGVAAANGDADYVIYFEPKEIPAKSKRLVAYGYGEGLAGNPTSEGKVTMQLRGSFEPSKLFSITAYVEDPIEGQTLTLDLPDGMERLEGGELQPVPAAVEGGMAAVLWKARVQRPGQFTMHVRSNSGAVYSRTVTISKQ